MDSGKIKNMLAKKYLDSRRFFVTEVKNGQSYNEGELCIMDAVAIAKSRAKFKIIGFEIKVSRADFLGDQKWHAYLKYSHEFRFVVPEGLIQKEELPDNIGLMYAKEDGTLKIIKRAKHEEKQIPADFFKYIIFSRIDPQYPKEVKDTTDMKDYVEGKKESRELGRKLGSKLGKEAHRLNSDLDFCKEKQSKNEERRNRIREKLSEMQKNGYFKSDRGYYGASVEEETTGKIIECLGQMARQIDAGGMKMADLDKMKELERYLNLSHKMVNGMLKEQDPNM